MISILTQVYTPIPIACLIVGFTGKVFYDKQRAKWLDKHRPLADGELHRVSTYNRVVAGISVGVFLLGYALVKLQNTQDTTVENSEQIKRCVVEFQNALSVRSKMSADDLRLSKEIDKLRSENDKALAKFLERRFNPPPDIAPLDADNPRRLQWRDDITRIYAEWQVEINKKIVAKQGERDNIDEWRESNPLPALKC